MTTVSGWRFRELGSTKWHASLGGEVAEIYPDLIHHREIPDPFIDDNELQVQWVADREWEYSANFTMADISLQYHQLVCDGLDTFTTIFVNETKVATTENMFITYIIPLAPDILISGTNSLRIVFHQALLKGKQLEKEHFIGKFSNGELLRLYVRKAQYQYGWDWGPRLILCGPYKPIRYEAYNQAISDVYVSTDSIAEDTAEVSITVELINCKEWQCEIFDPNGDTVVFSKSSEPRQLINISLPQLWWPLGSGLASLYTVTVTIPGTDISRTFKFGIRTVELIQEPLLDEDGESFYFKVNGKPIFIQGANWIPPHSFPTKVTDDMIKDLIQLTKKGGLNCLRVWGGGLYASDYFLTECDRQGILVWHDFPFACGQYPAYPEFIENVTAEVVCNLKRMRNHPCMLVFAGNNEDYQIAEQFKLEWERHDHSGNYTNTNFPARQLYEVVFPEQMAKYLPTVPYHPGSPWSGDYPTSDPLRGDLHQWNVWHGTQEPYQHWYKLGGRFVSEFGMEAIPSPTTLQDYITDKRQWYPQLKLMEHHNKAFGFVGRLSRYVFENLRVDCLEMTLWVFATQLMQAECLGMAFKHWRRRWRHRSCGGALVWQLNDCWPATLWLIIDFKGIPKLAYYAIKRECQPITLGSLRGDDGSNCEVWGVNMTSETIKKANLVIQSLDISSGKVVDSKKMKVTFLPNQATELTKYKLPPEPVLVHLQLIQGDKELTSNFDWPQPSKYLHFSGIKVTTKVEDGIIKLTTNKPTKAVVVLTPTHVVVDDNGFDMVPDFPKIIKAPAIKPGDKVDVTWYAP